MRHWRSDRRAVETTRHSGQPRFGTWDADKLSVGAPPNDISEPLPTENLGLMQVPTPQQQGGGPGSGWRPGSRRSPTGPVVPADDTEPTGAALLELVAVMDRLRSPGGCPWDAEQTHGPSLSTRSRRRTRPLRRSRPQTMQHCARNRGSTSAGRLPPRIGEEASAPWNIDDVARGICDKLISRHDHVFGAATVTDAADSERAWQLKRRRRRAGPR